MEPKLPILLIILGLALILCLAGIIFFPLIELRNWPRGIVMLPNTV